MVDVHSDFNVFLKPVKPYLPAKEVSTAGRTPSRYRIDQKPVRIDEMGQAAAAICMEENYSSRVHEGVARI